MDKKAFAKALIEALGGQVAAARTLGMHRQSLYYWLKKGIPKQRMSYIELAFPKIVKRVEDDLAAAQNQTSTS